MTDGSIGAGAAEAQLESGATVFLPLDLDELDAFTRTAAEVDKARSVALIKLEAELVQKGKEARLESTAEIGRLAHSNVRLAWTSLPMCSDQETVCS